LRNRYIKASEIKSFAFCERAWLMERKGVRSALKQEQAFGQNDHRRHGLEAGRAEAKRRLSSLLLILGLIGLAVALWWQLR
jgi:hypothetical protein